MKTKRYLIKVIEKDNDITTIERTNDGFTAIELLGILELAQLDILKQMSGKIKPRIIKRTYIETDKTKKP